MHPAGEVLAHQDAEGLGAKEGAAALCGNGETHEVRDRSRADGRRPIAAHIGIIGGESAPGSDPLAAPEPSGEGGSSV